MNANKIIKFFSGFNQLRIDDTNEDRKKFVLVMQSFKHDPKNLCLMIHKIDKKGFSQKVVFSQDIKTQEVKDLIWR